MGYLAAFSVSSGFAWAQCLIQRLYFPHVLRAGMIVVTFDFRMGPLAYFRRPSNLTLSDGDDVISFPKLPRRVLSCAIV